MSPDRHIAPIYEDRTFQGPLYRSPSHTQQGTLYRSTSGWSYIILYCKTQVKQVHLKKQKKNKQDSYLRMMTNTHKGNDSIITQYPRQTHPCVFPLFFLSQGAFTLSWYEMQRWCLTLQIRNKPPAIVLWIWIVCSFTKWKMSRLFKGNWLWLKHFKCYLFLCLQTANHQEVFKNMCKVLVALMVN